MAVGDTNASVIDRLMQLGLIPAGFANIGDRRLSILALVPEIEPVGLGLFAGSLAPQLGQLPEYQGSPFGDYRDWDAIGAWARKLVPALLAGPPRAAAP